MTTPPTPEFPTLNELVQLALSGDTAAIRQIVLLYPGKASYNATRQALQIKGCNPETVVAHIPLNAESLAEAIKYFPNNLAYASR